MRAAVLHEVGKPLSVEDVPEPEAGEGQSVVDVKAAGINFADVLIRNGQYPQPPPLPTILGNEVAGDLDGRRVVAFARQTGGGYAERVAVDDQLGVRPAAERELLRRALRFLTTYLTAWIPFMRQARLHPGSNVLVTAAAGGVGTAAIQLAVFLGATVTAAAGSEEKLALARELGATRTVSYEEIGELDDVDVALDPVGGAVFTACVQALRPLGVAIAIGFAGGAWEPVDPARLVGRNVGVQGFYPRPAAGLPARARPRGGRGAAGAVAARRDPAGRGRGVPARRGERGARPDRVAQVDREGRPCSLRPLS